jgi:Dynein light chain type 1
MQTGNDAIELAEVNVNLGSLAGDIKKKALAVLREHEPTEETKDQADESTIDQNIAAALKKEIDTLTKSNWHAIVGTKFSISVGVQKECLYAHYKTNRLNIILLESKISF